MSRIASALLGGVALVAVGAAPSLAASPFDGAYVGAMTSYSKDDSAGKPAGIDADGWQFGGYTGYGQTFDGFYFGAEAELSGSTIDDTATIGTVTTKYKVNESYGLAARAGYLLSDTVLLYGRAGWQRTNFEATLGTGASRINIDDTLDGVRVGGGLEFALTDNVLARVEYNHTNYEQDVKDNQIRFGVAYRF